MDDAADAEAEEAVDLAHPFGVAPGEIVVHRHDMDALAFQGVQIDGQGGDQGLAFAGLHLRDRAAVQHDAAHELDVEMALAQGAGRGLAHRGEGVRQDVLQALALGQALAQPDGARPQIVVAERLDGGLERVDGRDDRLQGVDVAVVGRAENPLGKRGEHAETSNGGGEAPLG